MPYQFYKKSQLAIPTSQTYNIQYTLENYNKFNFDLYYISNF